MGLLGGRNKVYVGSAAHKNEDQKEHKRKCQFGNCDRFGTFKLGKMWYCRTHAGMDS